MTSAVRQYSLGLAPPPARRSLKDYVVAESNAAALDMLTRWWNSAETVLVISGPPGSGKTHLLNILTEAADEPAGRTNSGSLTIIDDANRRLPRDLLAQFETARETGARLALGGSGDPRSWAQGLRDLETRLGAATRIDLTEPDDALLRAVITKLFRDRQLRAKDDLAAYAAARLPKTFAAANAFVDSVDAASIAQGAPLGLRLAKRVIDNLSEEPLPA
jgi:chromosomal replication initiation ATPase DnaA